ncbi:MAG: DMT family transporter [Saprospiraceae bacterium]|nr:DMT family transporter [Saprospiraceae bacterium]MCB9344595.1 DMT family transporter [Lewinellaceae bacterium]
MSISNDHSSGLTPIQLFSLTFLTLLAFAGNSILCRLALRETSIDAASFTSIRLASGAIFLWFITLKGSGGSVKKGYWISAFALFTYAAAFSFAYLDLTAATGALLLFGAVQCTMIGYSIWKGEKLSTMATIGIAMAIIGLLVLLLPGLETPPLGASIIMLLAGVAWGVYTLLGKKATKPELVTAGNFIRATPMAIALSLVMVNNASPDRQGVLYAIISGALASGLGYVLWYKVLRQIKTSLAATLQLSVPVLAALGGIISLGENITQRLVLASVFILGGIVLVIRSR